MAPPGVTSVYKCARPHHDGGHTCSVTLGTAHSLIGDPQNRVANRNSFLPCLSGEKQSHCNSWQYSWEYSICNGGKRGRYCLLPEGEGD
ncbi:hypothetical protein GDO81_025127 [Engystomops pustulosus]|uniref:Uncharacterized protein n=1 Tax=Engystomops pustulosus TaxID=76066 RepID=A0AAV6ZTB0_ENGPU|nr:hypothetical protein GDO81_025127 [Engystomops pustulosus]